MEIERLIKGFRLYNSCSSRFLWPGSCPDRGRRDTRGSAGIYHWDDVLCLAEGVTQDRPSLGLVAEIAISIFGSVPRDSGGSRESERGILGGDLTAHLERRQE